MIKPNSKVTLTFQGVTIEAIVTKVEDSSEIAHTGLPESFCVKNDGSQRFKDTVVKYLDQFNDGTQNFSLGEIGDYYGKKGKMAFIYDASRDMFGSTELTIDQFCELAGITCKEDLQVEPDVKPIYTNEFTIPVGKKEVPKITLEEFKKGNHGIKCESEEEFEKIAKVCGKNGVFVNNDMENNTWFWSKEYSTFLYHPTRELIKSLTILPFSSFVFEDVNIAKDTDKPALPDGYEFLKVGDVIQEGDMFLPTNRNEWFKSALAGQTITKNDDPYCRPIKKEQQKESLYSQGFNAAIREYEVKLKEFRTWIGNYSASLPSQPILDVFNQVFKNE